MIVYAYMRNPFIHESAAYPVSLHDTKAGAWRAMRADMQRRWQAERDEVLQRGKRWGAPWKWQEFFIEAMTVNSDTQEAP